MVLPLIGNDQKFKVITTIFSAVVVSLVTCFDVNISAACLPTFYMNIKPNSFLKQHETFGPCNGKGMCLL
jgi:hypothetical protein